MSSSTDPTSNPSPNPDAAEIGSNAPTVAPTSGSVPTARGDVSTPSKQFGNYTLLDEIARGGMGVVYKARDNKLNRTVALKMILSGRFASDSDVRRFYQEAESAANLDHSGIVPIYEIGEQEGHHFFSMKMIEGGSLAELLPKIRDDHREAAKLIAEIARAVHHAHQRGILHRDLKPANILIDTDGSPLVSDLGLAKDTSVDSGLTYTGAVVGTPGYMPPEQADGSKEITTAADIYSLGAMLYEALTGRPPHKGTNVVDTLRKVVEEEPALPRSLNGKVNRSLQLICMKCLSKDPNQRYASAAALADDLENWLEGKRVSVRPPSLSSTLGEVLLSNLRSALGAAVIGVLAGWCAGHCMAYLASSGDVIENPPGQIYAAMHEEIPSSINAMPVNTVQISNDQALLCLGLYVSIAVAGMAVALLTRPQSNNAAFTIGAVAAILMTCTMFVQTSFTTLGTSMHDATFDDLKVLAELAVAENDGVPDARKSFAERFPSLAEVEKDEQANTLAYYLYYQSVFAIPIPMLFGFGFASLFCIFPCMLGTTYSSKLIRQKTKWWKWLLQSFEFGWLLTTMCSFVFLVTIVGLMPDASGPFELEVGQQIFMYAMMVIIAAGIYRQKLRLWWRILLYVVLGFGSQIHW